VYRNIGYDGWHIEGRNGKKLRTNFGKMYGFGPRRLLNFDSSDIKEVMFPQN
jgi:hypothetical protein